MLIERNEQSVCKCLRLITLAGYNRGYECLARQTLLLHLRRGALSRAASMLLKLKTIISLQSVLNSQLVCKCLKSITLVNHNQRVMNVLHGRHFISAILLSHHNLTFINKVLSQVSQFWEQLGRFGRLERLCSNVLRGRWVSAACGSAGFASGCGRLSWKQCCRHTVWNLRIVELCRIQFHTVWKVGLTSWKHCCHSDLKVFHFLGSIWVQCVT